jgi:hypothetical protein
MDNEEFIENIKKWVHYDSMMVQYRQEIKSIQEQKDVIHQTIMNHLQSNNMENITINISDGYLKVSETNSTTAITLQFLRSCLDEFFKNEDMAERCFQFIKQKRQTKQQKGIKRYFS